MKEAHHQLDPRQFGGVFMESLLTLPLMLFLMLWLLDSGRKLEQATWLAQTAYQAAFAGAESIEVERENTMELLSQRLAALHNVDLRRQPVQETTISYEALPNRRMAVTLTATVKSPWNQELKEIRSRMTNSVLVASNEVSSELSNFGNSEDQFDCCGEKCVGADCPASCVSCAGGGTNPLTSLDADVSCSIVQACH
jgi:hypothetical protein